MSDKQELVDKILEIEWDMFTNVPNAGGKASCQGDKKTFGIMRSSQAMAWSEEVLESYHRDLVKAKMNQRNLMTEKYGWMMEGTFPDEFHNNVKKYLPKINFVVAKLVRDIAGLMLQWTREMYEKYPLVCEAGRPMDSGKDSAFATSLETYFKGELKTYSQKTLQLLYDFLVAEKESGHNIHEQILNNTVLQYGYTSLEDAESKLEEKLKN